MVYADLNPVRVGIAATLGDSDFTSAQERTADSGLPEPVSGTVAANDRRFRQAPFRQQRHRRVPLQRRSKDDTNADRFGSLT